MLPVLVVSCRLFPVTTVEISSIESPTEALLRFSAYASKPAMRSTPVVTPSSTSVLYTAMVISPKVKRREAVRKSACRLMPLPANIV